MFFIEPPVTRYDLNFTLLGTRVRVHPFFWLASVLMGGLGYITLGALGLLFIAIWVGCVFVSILVHEFGHVLVGRHFGSPGHIVLYGFGGLAVGSNRLSNRWQRIAVSLAGPGAQFLLLAVVLAVKFVASGTLNPFETRIYQGRQAAEPEVKRPDLGERNPDEERPGTLNKPKDDSQQGRPERSNARDSFDAGDGLAAVVGLTVLNMLVWINSIWPILNLVPVWPLDGGQVCRELCEWRMPGTRGIRTSLYISIGTCIGCGLFVVLSGRILTALLFALLGYIAYQELQRLRGGGGGPGWGQPPRKPWEADPDWWKTGRRDPWS